MDIWVKIPTQWILDKENLPLAKFKWIGVNKSDFISALMIYIIIAHHANSERNMYFSSIGCARLSYTNIGILSGLSRAKISSGIKVLEQNGLIKKEQYKKTNVFEMQNYGVSGWAKLPAKSLYDDKLQRILPFHKFTLRSKVELNALKLYLLIAALRDNKKNHATPSYSTISSYTGIPQNDIRSSISFLINLNMIHVDKFGDYNVPEKRNNFYRLIGIDDYRHTGNLSKDNIICNELMPYM